MPSIAVTESQIGFSVIQEAYNLACLAGQLESPEESVCDSSRIRTIVYPIQSASVATAPGVEEWLKFQSFVSQWYRERGAMSSITEMVLCPAYQSIIGMGETAVSFILSKLESERDDPDQWFWALRALTGVDPVREEDRGNYPAMAQAWLQWAESKE